MKPAFLNKLFTVILAFVLLVLYMPRLSADENTADMGDTIDLVVGDIQTVGVNGLTRVSVTNPDVADISDAQSDKVSLLAKRAGETVLFLWDAAGKRSVKVRVVSEDLSTVKARVQKLLDEANIAGVSLEENLDEGKVVAEGSLSKEDRDRMSDILQPYSDNLLNLVKEEKSEDLIEVDMQVVEISTTLAENLGIQWGNTTSGSSANTSTAGISGSTTTGVQLGYNEQGVPFGDKFKDLFKIGNFERATPLQATVDALVQEGKAKLISKPRLVVVSGKQASFLVGGEIPINNTTTNSTGSSQTTSTSFAQYGVNMTVTPTIREGKIDVLLNVDIRDIDGSTPLTSSSSGSGNIAFITRTASTDLLMDNKQTIAMAGLIKYSDSVTYTSVPFLSKIPILGGLFREKTIPGDTNTEMVIILTPTVLSDKKFANNQLVMPTPEEKKAWKEIDSKYEHEPLPSWPVAKAVAAVDSNDAPAVPATLPITTTIYAHNDLPPVVAATPGDMTAYARMVQEKISKAIFYPQGAMTNTLSGTVKLKLHILKDGSLDSEEVIESSGNDTLDQYAMQAAKKAAPYDAFATGMDQPDMIFTIPIVYNKLISGSHEPADKVIAAY